MSSPSIPRILGLVMVKYHNKGLRTKCCIYMLPNHAVGSAGITQNMIDSQGRWVDNNIQVEVQRFG